jgi:hypothetical protein
MAPTSVFMVEKYASGREIQARVDDSQAVAADYRYDELNLIWIKIWAGVPTLTGQLSTLSRIVGELPQSGF